MQGEMHPRCIPSTLQAIRIAKPSALQRCIEWGAFPTDWLYFLLRMICYLSCWHTFTGVRCDQDVSLNGLSNSKLCNGSGSSSCFAGMFSRSLSTFWEVLQWWNTWNLQRTKPLKGNTDLSTDIQSPSETWLPHIHEIHKYRPENLHSTNYLPHYQPNAATINTAALLWYVSKNVFSF